VSREDEVARLVETAEAALGSIDVLINNAGIAHKDAFLEMDVAEWDRILRVNLRGMFLVAQAVARRMVTRGSGVIVNMASTNALGGEELWLVPSLNAEPAWVKTVAGWVRRNPSS